MIKLKTITPDSIPAAIEMAKNYRLVNEPDGAESICLDVLSIDPDNQEAMITRLLALTDKFASHGLVPAFEHAKEVVEQLDSQYCKLYYKGIIFERRAKYHLKQTKMGSGNVAHEWFVKALDAFGKALASCDPNNQDAVLRWNSCARIINTHPDIKADAPYEPEGLLDAFDEPH